MTDRIETERARLEARLGALEGVELAEGQIRGQLLKLADTDAVGLLRKLWDEYRPRRPRT